MATTGRPQALSRREFITSAIAAALACAVPGAHAQNVARTDPRGLVAGMVDVQGHDGEIQAYRAMPIGASRAPIVLVLHDIHGLDEQIKDVCRRFARAGYLAVAPDLYFREGNVAELKDADAIVSKVVSRVADVQVMGDVDGAARWAAKNKGDAEKLATIGFGWGGRITWLYSAFNQRLRAAVAWHGALAGAKGSMTPKQPIDVAKNVNAAVLGLYGGADGAIPPDSIDAMKAALAAAGKQQSQFVVYPDVPAAFYADTRASYHKAAFDDGWQRTIAWLKDHGIA
jgi:carboxymethylenebutenolidase